MELWLIAILTAVGIIAFIFILMILGGIDPDGVRKAYFNGADVVILNIISSGDPNNGILETINFSRLIPSILSEVGE